MGGDSYSPVILSIISTMKKKRIDVFLLHGIAKEVNKDTYYNDFVGGIRKNLPIDVDIGFHPIDYSHILKAKEDIIYSWMADMGRPSIRKWACDYVCDVIALGYPKSTPKKGDFIYDLTEMLNTKYDFVNANYPDSKKVVIGHSLGSVIGYGFTWERKIDTLITMGSPFLYFSIRFKNFGMSNFNLPKFYNFWKKYDLVSTKVSRNPNFSHVHDIQVKSFNPLNWFTFKSHSAYWRSDFVRRSIAKILVE